MEPSRNVEMYFDKKNTEATLKTFDYYFFMT